MGLGPAPAPPAAACSCVPAGAAACSCRRVPGIPVSLEGPPGAPPRVPRAAVRPRLRGSHCVGLPLAASAAGARLGRSRPPGTTPPLAAAAPYLEPRTPPPVRRGEAALRLGVTPEASSNPGGPRTTLCPPSVAPGWRAQGSAFKSLPGKRDRSAQTCREVAPDSPGTERPFPTLARPRTLRSSREAGTPPREQGDGPQRRGARPDSEKSGPPGFYLCDCPRLLCPDNGQTLRAAVWSASCRAGEACSGDFHTPRLPRFNSQSSGVCRAQPEACISLEQGLCQFL